MFSAHKYFGFYIENDKLGSIEMFEVSTIYIFWIKYVQQNIKHSFMINGYFTFE